MLYFDMFRFTVKLFKTCHLYRVAYINLMSLIFILCMLVEMSATEINLFVMFHLMTIIRSVCICISISIVSNYLHIQVDKMKKL